MALGYMRRHRRWLYGFLWLVIAAFIILYIPAFQGGDAASPGEALAEVGGTRITVGEYQRAYVERRQFYDRMAQGRLDPATLRSLGLEEQAFQGLVEQRLIELEARRLGLAVSDEALAHRISTSPQFQRNGVFVGAAEIRRLLDLQGLSVEQFEAEMRAALLRERLESLVTDGVMVPPAEVERAFRQRQEQVRVEYVQVDASRFGAESAVTDAEVQERFAKSAETYRFPERRVADLALVSLDAVRKEVAVTDADLQAYYADHKDELTEEAQVCASHVLVRVKADAQAAEGHPEDEARALAQKLLDQIEGGADFATVAKASSEDKGSAGGGGDLGCFPRGRMVPEFDNVVFDMKAGETSDLVKTNFGYHVIRVNGVREESTPPLTQVKEQIRQQIVQERAQSRLQDRVQAVAEALARGRTLEQAAAAQGLTVQKSVPLGRGDSDPVLPPAAVSRLFEMKPGEADPLAQRGPKGLVFIRLAEVQPSRLPELKEVQDKVRADLVGERSRGKSRALAEQLRAAAEKVGLEKAASALGLVRKETPALVGRGQSLAELGINAALEEAAYGLPPQGLSAVLPTTGGHAVLRVLERKEFDPAAFEREKGSLAASLREERKRQLFDAYLEQARRRYPVERNLEAFRRIVSG